MSGKPSRDRAGTFALLILLAASLGLNVFLGVRLGRAGAAPTKMGGIQVGQDLSELVATDGRGGKGRLFLGSDARETLLYVFSPSCSWCAKDHRNIVALGSQTQSKYRVVALALHARGLTEYLDLHPFPSPFETQRLQGDPATHKGLEVTPQTVIVGADGRVRKVWVGAALPNTKQQMESYFTLSLPGAAN